MSNRPEPHTARHGPLPSPTRARRTRRSPALQGTLALDLLASQPGLPETPELDLRAGPGCRTSPTPRCGAWAARFAQAVVEVVGGQRPVSQLRPLDRARRATATSSAARTSSVAPRAGAGRSVRPQVRSVHVCRPTATSAEVSVHVRHGDRSRALAMRLERRGDRWPCTVLEFG